MKNWMIWVILAWFIISSLGLFGIYNTLREMKSEISGMKYDLKDVRDAFYPPPPFTAPTKRLPPEEKPPDNNTEPWQPSWAK